MSTDGIPGGTQRAGWFTDPSGTHRWRRWDGQRWTRDVDDHDTPPEAVGDEGPTALGGAGAPREPDPAPSRATAAAASGASPRTKPDLSAMAPPTGVQLSGGAQNGVVDVGPAAGRRFGLGLLAATGLLMATFLAGTGVGWQILDQRSGATHDESEEPAIIEVRVPTLEVEGDGGVMPDLRGLDEDVAREILADTVLTGEAPVVDYVPWAGEPGVVIGQRPAFGSIAPVAVQLVVAEQATVPEVAGQPLDEIVDQLESLGTRVEVIRRFEDGVNTDLVLESRPPAGSALPGLVTIVASERTASIFLTSLQLVDGRCSRTEQSFDAVLYSDALSCSASRSGSSYAWLLSRAAQRLEGTIGLPDEGPADTDIRLDFYVDEELVNQTVIGYGESIDIGIQTAGGLRLRIDGQLAEGENAPSTSATFVLGDMRLVGAADALAELRDGS